MKRTKIFLVPSEQGSLDKNRGCAKAPAAIIKALEKEGIKPENESVAVVQSDIEATDEAIFLAAKKAFAEKAGPEKFPVFLGGDHSITYSLFRAFSKTFGKDSALVIFDAHADCCQFFKPVSHEDMNKVLVEEGLLKPENLLIIGLRKVFDVEKGFLRKNKIKSIAPQTANLETQKARAQLRGFLAKRKNIYVSIDIDAFDPGFAPATGYPEKKGLLEKPFFSLLDVLLESGKVKAYDLVEANPSMNGGRKTVGLAARIIGKIARFRRISQ
ncbi:MAG: arginase family protein [Candidatus Diapherotrites archaeon]|nr:arginase family protein [Candidatus Diapherotrites archaeon]